MGHSSSVEYAACSNAAWPQSGGIGVDGHSSSVELLLVELPLAARWWYGVGTFFFCRIAACGLIYLSLIAIASDPSLFTRFNNPDNIIFTERDFKNPVNSELIRILRNSKDETIRRCVNHLISGINKEPSAFPDLATVLTTPIPAQTPVTLDTPQAPRVVTPQAPRVVTPQAPRVVTPQAPTRKFDKKVKIIIPLAGVTAVLFLFYIFAVQPINQVTVPMPLPSQVTVPMPLPSQVTVPMPLPSQVTVPMPLPSQDIFAATSNKDDNLHLLTYNDPENGVSIMYPDNWKIYKTIVQFLKGYPIVTLAKGSDLHLMVTTEHIGNITSPATFLRKIMLPELEKNDNFTLLNHIEHHRCHRAEGDRRGQDRRRPARVRGVPCVRTSRGRGASVACMERSGMRGPLSRIALPAPSAATAAKPLLDPANAFNFRKNP